MADTPFTLGKRLLNFTIQDINALKSTVLLKRIYGT